MLMKRLRAETEVEHKAMEEALDLMNPEATFSDYVVTVQVFEAFVRAWEESGEASCPANMRTAFLQRQRHKLLQDDLEYLKAAPLTEKPALPSFSEASSFLGAMYVMEGSTLGGQFISRHVEKTYGLEGGKGYSFFQGHGANTGRLWKEFSALLEEQIQKEAADGIVAGAKDMFNAFHRWVEFYRTISNASEQSGTQA
jgi:heme oxygenase